MIEITSTSFSYADTHTNPFKSAHWEFQNSTIIIWCINICLNRVNGGMSILLMYRFWLFIIAIVAFTIWIF